MTSEPTEYYYILLSLCQREEISLTESYKQMRNLLERLCRTQMQDESLQMTDLSARISYVAAKIGLDIHEQNRLHTFRLTSNKILHRQEKPDREKLLRDAKTLAFFVKRLFGQDIPAELYRLLPKVDATYTTSPLSARGKIRRMRVCFQYSDETYLYVTPVDDVADEPLRVCYHIPDINIEFDDTCKLLWQHAQINLLDVQVDKTGVLIPSFIVLEPDYLIDISALAECFREYGHHPANYNLSKLQSVGNSRPLLLGNIANLFLDEWIHAPQKADYRTCMKKAFQRYAIELIACVDLQDPEIEKKFFADAKLHFENIGKTVTETFPMSGYELDKTDAVIEPSYVCEALGLQGRLDYMQRDMLSFIEMKSGKADEYTIRNKIEPKENHKAQMLLYQAVLEYAMGIDHHKGKAYLFYTRYPLLYPARSSWTMVRKIINLRNCIVSDEYNVQRHNSIEYTTRKLSEINSETLNEKGLTNVLWTKYLFPPIDDFAKKLQALTPVEQAYYYSLYNFITKEQYTAKSGDTDYEGSRGGTASLWLSSLAEKCEAGEILYDLKIMENRAADEHKAYVILSKTSDVSFSENMPEALPNFRPGDAIVFYERNKDTDNVTNKMVFKGNIETITENDIKLRLRSPQLNPAVLPALSLYAVEHDASDVTFRAMFFGLSAFVSANQERRNLLLGQRLPEFDTAFDSRIAAAKDDITRITLKAQAAKDYFLLVGPPGTGKTSHALKQMAEIFHQDERKQILFLAYTNRATDEICKALSSICPQPDYIRIGSELPCDPVYREHLIENVLADCVNRKEAQERIARCHIFVETAASISNKPELFRLKHFDVAIVDEATQILEPQLLGILCARNEDGRNAVGKFILMGDHKQLPAVVLQSSLQSEIHNEALRAVGLTNLKDSLFERLYRSLLHPLSKEARAEGEAERAYDQLRKQGRMHPAIAAFPNKVFYGGTLESLNLPHQTEELVLFPLLKKNREDKLMKQRVALLSSLPDISTVSGKVNHSEAVIVARLAHKIFIQYGTDFDAGTLGIITPYRNQIALIKREIAPLGIAKLNNILVDTVERFQGSERDVIIYSFCINYAWQLQFLSNTVEENGMLIDRKLNVALTRARKQLFVTGAPDLLRINSIYVELLKAIDENQIQ
ncbi:RecBCD enzyme subunit RecD [termite gut metagenome]|uniref:RecBCD enzyme subunit RecD n=1 Tax=termite gut metagenome TaxID=433724 RepID=A0A5J4SGI4_9ZZZZ